MFCLQFFLCICHIWCAEFVFWELLSHWFRMLVNSKLNLLTFKNCCLRFQVWWWAVGRWRWCFVYWLSLESVHRGSPWWLQPPLPILLCITHSSTLNQVINQKNKTHKLSHKVKSASLMMFLCVCSSTLVTRSNTLPSRRTLKNSRLVCKKDDVHVCVMCLRAIMNYQVIFHL